jgi:hypothetical protein
MVGRELEWFSMKLKNARLGPLLYSYGNQKNFFHLRAV